MFGITLSLSFPGTFQSVYGNPEPAISSLAETLLPLALGALQFNLCQ